MKIWGEEKAGKRGEWLRRGVRKDRRKERHAWSINKKI